ncbi:T9SS-dependent choice-of-anchor J family protein [Carboxylicivirga linearis]|uniref:Choice-of-anchor J domain-containing protein n=1 Tax=Carboxylicivirga linearis TaxID=1628157 RepID=A0ABS5K1A7_9BACT|nr:choice-of-anchor J domain-containing protein [Carboxylicivirga linearis]MBS2100885.1 choice-of-anchor J domain-containing protein [Carboxylicivirga linearis]
MKKIYFLFLFILVGMNAAIAQVAGSSLNEDFSGDAFPPVNWKEKLLSGSINWTVLDEPGNETANRVAGFSGYGNTDDFLITPQLLPTNDNNQIQFRIRSGEYNYEGVSLHILISTGYTDFADFSTELLTLSTGAETTADGITTDWEYHTIDLSDYVDSPVYIAFEAVGYISTTFYIDDVTGVAQAQYNNDLQVQNLELPSDNPFIYENDQITVSTTIKNLGSNSVVDSPVRFDLDGVEYVVQNISLTEGEEITVSKQITASKGSHQITVSISSDDFEANNSLEGSVFLYPEDALLESFEGDVFPPVYWTIEGEEIWSAANFNQSHGDFSASCTSSGYKLITPKLDVALGDSLCFDAYISGTLEVASSVDGRNWEVIKTIELSDIYDVLSYQINFDANENTGFVGSRYFSFEIVGEYGYLYLDKVYGSTPLPVVDDLELVDFGVTNTSSFYANDPINFSIKVHNNGESALEKEISLSVNGTVISDGLTTGVVEPASDVEISFQWTPDQGYVYALFDIAIEPDDYYGNNTGSFAKIIYSSEAMELPFETSFEDWYTFPDFWTVDASTSTTWMQLTGNLYGPNATANNGDAVLGFSSYDYVNANMITPNISLSGDYYKVSFWMYRDDMEYYLDTDDKVNVYFNENPVVENAILIGSVSRSIAIEPAVEQAGWYQYQFLADCSDLTEGFFIFEGVGQSTYRQIYIDDLSIKAVYDVTFAITNNSKAIENAELTIDGQEGTLVTGADGKIVTQLSDGVYNYTVTTVDYETVVGQFEVNGSNENVDIQLVSTDISSNPEKGMLVYPNPFDSQITISTSSGVKSISMYDVSGNEVVKQSNLIINTSKLEKGVYIVVIECTNGEKIIKKLTK